LSSGCGNAVRALPAFAGKLSPFWREARDLMRSLHSALLTKPLPALASCCGVTRREASLRLEEAEMDDIAEVDSMFSQLKAEALLHQRSAL
jgi:hypothetical protein